MAKQKIALTFYGGANEIGGNKILLQDKGTRVFLDFGLSFAKEEKFFSGYLCPRTVNAAGDYLEFGLLPKLKGLYARDAIKNTKIKYVPPEVDGVFISHVHMDHVGYLQFVDEEIPVYCGEGTKIIIDALQETGMVDLGEHEYRTFRTGKTIRLGSLEVAPVHVDHSIPAAYGFIVHTSRGAIAYSGDLRIHGPMSNMTWEFADKANKSDVELMISEGTRVCPEESPKVHSETKVWSESDNVVANTSKLVVVSFYSRDVDRFKTFYEIAKKNDRKFIIPLKLAYLLNKLKTDKKLKDKIPDVTNDDTVLLYKKRKKTGEFVESDYYKWERAFLDKAVNYKYVRENQSKIVFNLDLVGFTELIDVKPSPGGHFIHSMSEPFSEEDIDAAVMHNWLKHFGLKFHQIHASGHCPSKDLQKVVNRIRPKRLIPIHTEYPELFKKLFSHINVKIVKEGKTVQL